MKRFSGFVVLAAVLVVGFAIAAPPEEEKAKTPQPTAKQKTPAAKPGKNTVAVRVFNREGKLVGPIESPKVSYSLAEWKRRLSPDQFKILRSKGTEQAFCGTLLDNKLDGVYTCAGCGLPLFASDSKFHSGTGWPSFFQPISAENVSQHSDRSHGMVRTEITCTRCGGHLGHVFEDGPKPTGLRFCLNSESLTFTESDKLSTLADPIAEGAALDKADAKANSQKEASPTKPGPRSADK